MLFLIDCKPQQCVNTDLQSELYLLKDNLNITQTKVEHSGQTNQLLVQINQVQSVEKGQMKLIVL